MSTVVCILEGKLLIIGAGIEQIYAYQTAKKMGFSVVGTDANPNAPALIYSDEKLIASTRDPQATIEAVKSLKDYKSIKGVITLANDVPYTVAYVAEALGLPSISLQTAALSSDKLKMKNRFKDSDVNTPVFAEAKTYQDLQKFIQQWGYPAVAKPTDGRGSRGVVFIDENSDLEWVFSYCLSHSCSNKIIIEKFIEGKQISTEGLVVEGKIFNSGYADRNYEQLQNFKPFILEDGGSMPSKISNLLRKKIDKQLSKAAQAIELNNGSIKGDIVIDDDHNVYVIEIATRLSGGFFCTDQIPVTTGVDLVLQSIRLAVGLPVEIDDLTPKHLCFSEIRYWFPKIGKLVNVPNINSILAENNVLKAMLLHPKKTNFMEVSKHSDRLGFVIVTSKHGHEFTKKRADKIINKYYKDFEFLE